MPNLHDLPNYHELNVYYDQGSAAWWIEKVRKEEEEIDMQPRVTNKG